MIYKTENTKKMDVRNLPNHKRGYVFENIANGQKNLETKLRVGLKNHFDFDSDEKLESKYQTIYSSIFTRKHDFYLFNDVKISIVSLDEYLENMKN